MYAAPLPSIKVTVGGEYGGRRGHKGVDLRAKAGTPVAAVIGGEYVRSGFSSTHGYFGIWLGDDGNYWNVQHLKVPFGERGRIEVAEVIALTGSTGNVSGPHLHIGVSTRNSLTLGTFDPIPLLTAPPAPPTIEEIMPNPIAVIHVTNSTFNGWYVFGPGHAVRTTSQADINDIANAYVIAAPGGAANWDGGWAFADDAAFTRIKTLLRNVAGVPLTFNVTEATPWSGGTGGAGGGYNPADADVVDEGELGQALTSTVNFVNQHADANKTEILTALGNLTLTVTP